MKKLLAAAVVASVAVTVPLPAQAAPRPAYVTSALPQGGPGYAGGCTMVAVNDVTPGGQLGGGTTWNAVVALAVTPSSPGTTVTAASCWVKVTVSGSESPVLTAAVTGPVAAGAGQASFAAGVTTTVYLCTHVTLSTGGPTDTCTPTTTAPVCPEQVCGDGGLLGLLDPVICTVLVTVAPVVDSLPTAGLLFIDPASGDTYVLGTGPSFLVWDCP